MKVKFCGLTREEDVSKAVSLGVDYVGFILYPLSKRYVRPERLKELFKVAEDAKKVAVFVEPSYEEVKLALDYGADLIQLHGDESIDFARKIGMERVIKAFRVKQDFSIDQRWKEAYAILLDTYQEGLYGGTGRTFDWSVARRFVEGGFRIFLSGGLNPQNVQAAVKEVRPYAVDVSSGIEKSPGVKDHKKMEEFMHAVKDSSKD
ncbi:phosphoribosylanthranilate isomerase [Thermocrinis minervae]|uniref:N-(5'-phosphoribosyl)anthranilate isomerase n=1 Tax=Thermocrinis minervae TaxID=381751 RepID=A0A1M6RDX1_9AQUI|nr:phosphoribosylanthranilate isomerase [Thermocrinis minervae]SHK30649.1 phosphoribosylanthranilate isomerase [Thermocrinis minervae]